jgi:Flp pilus assembly protein TadG
VTTGSHYTKVRRGVLTLRRFARERAAAAVVEFAIVVALLLVIVMGTLDWSRYFLLRTNLTNAVRDGARYGAVLSESAADTVLIRQYTRARITGPAAAQTAGTVTVSFAGTSGLDRRVRVKISGYPFDPATFLVIKTARTIADSAEFRREQP